MFKPYTNKHFGCTRIVNKSLYVLPAHLCVSKILSAHYYNAERVTYTNEIDLKNLYLMKIGDDIVNIYGIVFLIFKLLILCHDFQQ